MPGDEARNLFGWLYWYLLMRGLLIGAPGKMVEFGVS